MLKLKRREATILSINVRPEFHGKEIKTAVDISVMYMVSRTELCSMLRRDGADGEFFEEIDGIYQPKFGGVIGPIKILGKFEKSSGVFRIGIDLQEVAFEEAAVHGITVDPQIGGMSTVEHKISCLQTEPMKQLQDVMKAAQKLDLKIGKLKEKDERQADLPLGEAAPSNADSAIAQDEADQKLAESGDLQPDEETKVPKRKVRDHKAKRARRKAAKGGK